MFFFFSWQPHCIWPGISDPWPLQNYTLLLFLIQFGARPSSFLLFPFIYAKLSCSLSPWDPWSHVRNGKKLWRSWGFNSWPPLNNNDLCADFWDKILLFNTVLRLPGLNPTGPLVGLQPEANRSVDAWSHDAALTCTQERKHLWSVTQWLQVIFMLFGTVLCIMVIVWPDLYLLLLKLCVITLGNCWNLHWFPQPPWGFRLKEIVYPPSPLNRRQTAFMWISWHNLVMLD